MVTRGCYSSRDAFDRSPESIACTTLPRMAMGIREGEQSPLWVVTADLPKSPGHPFYTRLNALLDAQDFDRVRSSRFPISAPAGIQYCEFQDKEFMSEGGDLDEIH